MRGGSENTRRRDQWKRGQGKRGDVTGAVKEAPGQGEGHGIRPHGLDDGPGSHGSESGSRSLIAASGDYGLLRRSTGGSAAAHQFATTQDAVAHFTVANRGSGRGSSHAALRSGQMHRGAGAEARSAQQNVQPPQQGKDNCQGAPPGPVCDVCRAADHTARVFHKASSIVNKHNHRIRLQKWYAAQAEDCWCCHSLSRIA